MGKHERKIVEEAEKIITKLLKREKLTNKEEDHPFNKLNYKFTNLILKKYPDIIDVEHIGNHYDTRGDICITLKNSRKIYLELKFLDTGVGTLCNISQNALTILKIYNCKSWSDYRTLENHEYNIKKEFENFKYPQNINSMTTKSKIYKQAEYLKKDILKIPEKQKSETICADILEHPKKYTPDKILAADIILKIIKYDKQIKIKYLDLLSKSKYDESKFKLFCFLILTGIHTMPLLSKELNKNIDELFRNAENYNVYYLYKKTNEIEEEKKSKYADIINNPISISVNPEETSLSVFSIYDHNIKKKIISISLNWKNKFQGIETPCLNIFNKFN